MRNDASAWSRLWFASSLLASSCTFGVDPSAIGKGEPGENIAKEDAAAPAGDASEPEPDADVTDAERQEPDAEAADGGEPEPPYDAGDSPPDCPETGCGSTCSEDSACDADQYCSTLHHTCVARCTEQDGCVGPTVGFLTYSMLNDGESVFWASSKGARDVAGMLLRDGELWSWNLRDEPVRIAAGLLFPHPLFLSDGQIYYLDGAPRARRLYRTGVLLPSSPELLAEKTTHAWQTRDFVFWSVTTASGVELWRAPQEGAFTPERLALAEHEGWVGGNDQLAFHTETRGEAPSSYLVADTLSDLTTHRDVFGPRYSFGDVTVEADGSILYFRDPDHADGALRLDLAHPEEATWFAPQTGGAHFFIQAGWVYWATYDNINPPSTITWLYGRTHSALAAPSAELLRRTDVLASGSGYSIILAFTVLGNQIAYVNALEGRIFTRAAPPPPCSPSLACPTGQSCTESLLCE